MISPLIPYTLRGGIWYQGEANAKGSGSKNYKTQLATLIADWRTRWGQGDFAFAWVQLPNFKLRSNDPNASSSWAEIREVFLQSLAIPNTGMAITIDLGEAKNIHPKNQQTVGKRLSLWARAKVYGEKIPYSGPLPAEHAIKGDEITVSFTHADGGLKAKDGKLKGFAIAGADKKWVSADARIEGDKVIVSSTVVSSPVAVRYAWGDNPECNLYNSADLPISPGKYWDLYDRENLPLAPNPFRPKDAPAYAFPPSDEVRSYGGAPSGQHLPDDYARFLKQGYYAAISYVDVQVGRLLDELDRLGLRDDTIVVLWGEHGWKLGEHDAWAKHTNFENDTRVPLIISVPKMASAGKTSDALVELVDVYPTLAELAGFTLPKHLEGISFTPLLADPARAWKSAAFSQYPRKVGKKSLMGYSMRTDRYRYTKWVGKNAPENIEAVKLYDHLKDPQENTNIANDATARQSVEQLDKQWQSGWKAARPQ